MLGISDFAAILEQIEYKDWYFGLVKDGDRLCLQVEAHAPDTERSERPIVWHGRKWFLSPHMTHSEVVGTALKAVLTAEEHECRERFKWRGRAVFGPHIDINAMWHASGITDTREE